MSEAVASSLEGKENKGIGDFVQKTRAELDKTTFPAASDVQSTTIIVIVSVIFFAAYLFLVDHAWTYLLEGLTWLVNKIAGL